MRDGASRGARSAHRPGIETPFLKARRPLSPTATRRGSPTCSGHIDPGTHELADPLRLRRPCSRRRILLTVREIGRRFRFVVPTVVPSDLPPMGTIRRDLPGSSRRSIAGLSMVVGLFASTIPKASLLGHPLAGCPGHATSRGFTAPMRADPASGRQTFRPVATTWPSRRAVRTICVLPLPHRCAATVFAPLPEGHDLPADLRQRNRMHQGRRRSLHSSPIP